MALFNLLFVLMAAVSCNHNSGQQEQVQSNPSQPVTYPKDTFSPGVVISHVALRLDDAQSYALYLPVGYTDSSKLPVILFFDPHGEGDLPLKLYHELADKYHFILMGSNNSRNLIDFSQTTVFANNLANEAVARYSIDPSKITMMGFSGGAKVALNAGSLNPMVSTIIYAGSKEDVTPNHPVTLLGFAGTKDMNYTDVVQVRLGFEKNSYTTLFCRMERQARISDGRCV